jgi:hypothetical protein
VSCASFLFPLYEVFPLHGIFLLVVAAQNGQHAPAVTRLSRAPAFTFAGRGRKLRSLAPLPPRPNDTVRPMRSSAVREPFPLITGDSRVHVNFVVTRR